MMETMVTTYADSAAHDKWRCMYCEGAMPVIEENRRQIVVRCEECDKAIHLKARVGTLSEIRFRVRR